MADWHLYVIRTRHGALYTGIATDVSRRLAEHEDDGKRGAKYLRSKGPLRIAYQVSLGSRGLAQKAEQALKRLAKKDKERIVAGGPSADELLTILSIRD
jgi:putative endonuclease